MQLINADLHIHSRFSISTSKQMTFGTLAVEAPKKGINLVGSGDCLHQTWLKELQSLEKVDDGTFELNNIRFIPTVEVQGRSRIHHLIIFPSIGAVEQFRDKIKKISKNLSTDGRPHVPLTGDEIAQMAIDVDALIGPCHAFTPWTGLYGYFNSIADCYGNNFNKISFLELGLSADSNYADKISELRNLTYLSNSDAHSPYPLRLGREFNQFQVEDITFKEIEKAILRRGGRKCTLNAGLPPEEGKYNQSACSRCFTKYSLEDSSRLNWKCQLCGGRIKKGVIDRINELADQPESNKPEHRPDYLHLIPLAEIISKVLGHSSTNTQKVQKYWQLLISKFGNEIKILLEINEKEIEQITNSKLASAIKLFRENRIILHPGGGGKYGQIEIPEFD
jgi:uncharacterized protein (TIGR00375 family)